MTSFSGHTGRDFTALLEARSASGHSVCVGLDSDAKRLPTAMSFADDPQLAFNIEVVAKTAEFAAAYKLNSAFYEARGAAGIDTLIGTVAHIHSEFSDIPVIVDAKRGDIGSTNDGYADLLFDLVRADAITVHPYLGAEAAAPFLSRSGKGIFVLCRTSNPGAGEFQDLVVTNEVGEGRPLYQVVASTVATTWNVGGNCGLVVGATYPDELGQISSIASALPLLIPGVGAQGGDVERTMKALANHDAPVLINSSRGIIFASADNDFADAAGRATQLLHAEIKAAARR